MKGASRRPEQVAETVRSIVATALTTEIRDPRIGFTTVSRVQVTPDLSHAKIAVAVHGDEPEARAKALEGLKSCAGFLRSKVAKALSTRVVPELHFVIDDGLAHAARINEILAGLRDERVPEALPLAPDAASVEAGLGDPGTIASATESDVVAALPERGER